MFIHISFMKRSDANKFLKKFWDVVWRDDSPKGWIISLVFIFLVIKFAFFPLMTLATGTAFPLVIVESCSMYHDGNPISNFDDWWKGHANKYSSLDLDKENFEDFSMKKGFNKGDILFIVGTKPEKVKVGDVIIFNANYRNPIIHRVIDIDKKGEEFVFSTIGDNNNGQLSVEKTINEDQIIGKAKTNIAPYFGWIKLIFFEASRNSSERGFCSEN